MYFRFFKRKRTFGKVLSLPIAFLAILAVFAFNGRASAQIPLDIGVTVASTNPPQLNLVWSLNTWQTSTITTTQTLSRRVYGIGAPWVAIANLAYNANSYSDTGITAGVEYEYQLEQDFSKAVTFQGNSAAGQLYTPIANLSAGNMKAFGYICAGINLPYNDNRGTLLLLVDNTMSAPLATEITQLQQDLAGDGWTVLRSDLPRQTISATATLTGTIGTARLAELQNVKNVIKTAYNADSTHVKEFISWGIFQFLIRGTKLRMAMALTSARGQLTPTMPI